MSNQLSSSYEMEKPHDSQIEDSSLSKSRTDSLIEAQFPPTNHREDGLSGLNMSAEEEKKVTKSLLWKLDLRILPMLAVLFLFSFLDR